MQILYCIFNDFHEPFSYIPYGILISGLIMIFILLFRYSSGRNFVLKTYFIQALFILYVTVVLIQTYFSREPGSRNTIDLSLGGTWGADAQSKAYVIENILLFIPYGIMIPVIISRMRDFPLFVIVSVLLSTCLEMMQYISKRGHCQLDDIITNVLGSIIGYLIFNISKKIIRD